MEKLKIIKSNFISGIICLCLGVFIMIVLPLSTVTKYYSIGIGFHLPSAIITWVAFSGWLLILAGLLLICIFGWDIENHVKG